MGTERATDGELLARFIAGEQLAFTALVWRWSPRLRSFLLRYEQDEDRVKDLMQDTWFRIARNAARWDATKGKFSTWTFSISLHLAYNNLRDDKRRRRCGAASWPDGVDGQPFDPPDERPLSRPDQILELNELEEARIRTISELPDHHREVLTLRGLGETYDAMAEKIGVSVGTIKSRINRAREALAVRMAKDHR